MKERLSRLLSIKSLVTLTATAIFTALCLRGDVGGQEFLTIYTAIIGFYFGTQFEKGGNRQ